MKKVYTLIAIASLMVCAAACGNTNKKAEEEPAAEPQKEAPAKEKSTEDKLKEAAADAAIDLTKAGVDAATKAAQDAANK
jgi:hypothetical protein